MTPAVEKAVEIIRQMGGTIRTSEAIRKGVHPRELYALRDRGMLDQITRGVYRLAELAAISSPDLVTVASRAPHTVICLISALAFHNLTTQVPHEVSIAISRGSRVPQFHYPPVSVHKFDPESFKAGIEEHSIDSVKVRIYSPEKTLADCFKFRNKIGMDVVLEALKLYKERKKFNPGPLLKYARICRVEKVMKPYLEAMA
ncbi:MAG: type IV toxin-antitoxin system AbiEi family antitoxin domain-containing protein [Nitrospiraceae bacterium]|nr:type IV toxin-antitoxin system AbiEi family antitoxin domain-containing protein [Nitrospiraceae bacterium]